MRTAAASTPRAGLPGRVASGLIQIWRELIARGITVPKLVLMGKRGWGNEQTFRELDLSPDLKAQAG